jgi:putative transposase
VVWATKDRRPTIGDIEEIELRRSLELTIADLDLVPHAIGFMPDHVHLAISIPPKVPVAEAVRRLKGASSHAVNQAAQPSSGSAFAWQPEYGALTFGEKALSGVVAYVNEQRERHAGRTLWPPLERMADRDT